MGTRQQNCSKLVRVKLTFIPIALFFKALSPETPPQTFSSKHLFAKIKIETASLNHKRQSELNKKKLIFYTEAI